jgi:hypothetical protein
LDKADQDSTKLIQAIKSLGKWRHCFDSTWIVQSASSAVDITDYLWQQMGPKDKILVSELSGAPVWNGLDDTCSRWLEVNL